MIALAALAVGWVAPAIQVFVGQKPVAYGKAQPLSTRRGFLIPLRETVEAMGGTFGYSVLGRRATIVQGQKRVSVALDGGLSRVDGVPRRLRNPPWISKGEVVVPPAFFSETMGVIVTTNARKNLVALYPRGAASATATKGKVP